MVDLAKRALATNQAFLALGAEVFAADGATFVRDRSSPNVPDCNRIAHTSAQTPKEIERLLARAEREFAGFRELRFNVDFLTPPTFEARLAYDGYERNDLLVLVLEGVLTGEPRSHDLRLIDSDAAWREYETLHELDWNLYHENVPPSVGRWSAGEMFRSRRAKSPPARYWLAYVDGEARAYLTSWEGNDGVGQVDDLLTHPGYRHRGLATALIQRGVADCRERGAGPVVIVADARDTPSQMYAAMGFRPIAITRYYTKLLSGEKPAEST